MVKVKFDTDMFEFIIFSLIDDLNHEHKQHLTHISEYMSEVPVGKLVLVVYKRKRRALAQKGRLRKFQWTMDSIKRDVNELLLRLHKLWRKDRYKDQKFPEFCHHMLEGIIIQESMNSGRKGGRPSKKVGLINVSPHPAPSHSMKRNKINLNFRRQVFNTKVRLGGYAHHSNAQIIHRANEIEKEISDAKAVSRTVEEKVGPILGNKLTDQFIQRKTWLYSKLRRSIKPF